MTPLLTLAMIILSSDFCFLRKLPKKRRSANLTPPTNCMPLEKTSQRQVLNCDFYSIKIWTLKKNRRWINIGCIKNIPYDLEDIFWVSPFPHPPPNSLYFAVTLKYTGNAIAYQATPTTTQLIKHRVDAW